MRARIVPGVLTAALVASVLVATAPTASADIGDQTKFPWPNGVAGSGASALTLTASGDIWLAPQSGRSMISVSPKGAITLHPVSILRKDAVGGGIAQTPDGRIWFGDYTSTSLVSVDADGGNSRQSYPGTVPSDMVVGPDGNLWYHSIKDSVGRLVPGGGFTAFATPGTVSDVASGPGFIAFSVKTQPVVGRMTPDGAFTTVAVPDPTASVAVAPDGTIWAASATRDRVFKVSPAGSVSTVTLDANKFTLDDLLVAPDGSVWLTETAPGLKDVVRIAPDGSSTNFKFSDYPKGLTVGSDGNVWVHTNSSISRLLTGIAPTSTTAPAVKGSANTPGAPLTSTAGEWKFLPSSFAFQWQRCTANDPATCTRIADADKATYTITDADQGAWLQSTVSAKNLNGSSKPVGSALFQVAPKATAPTQPTQPTQPTGPAPVTGVGTVTLVPGVTATLTGPSSVKRKAKRTYRVTFKAPQPRGAVKISLVNATGAEAYVLTSATSVRGTKKTAYATKTARIPRSVPKGAYTLMAVYTPPATQAATYPVTTITKPLTLK